MSPKIGSMFTGYGGLDLAVPGELAWVSDIGRSPEKVLSYHFPETENLGDIQAVNWGHVEPVDIFVGGYPCQPFSVYGRKKGELDQRHLWPQVLEGLKALRPSRGYFENVKNHLNFGFSTVLDDLAEAGYSVGWTLCSASSAGAPHRRDRLYFVIYDVSAPYSPPKLSVVPEAGFSGPMGVKKSDRVAELERFPLLPTPIASDKKGEGRKQKSAHHNYSQLRDLRVWGGDKVESEGWGEFSPAIRRWEAIVGREAPNPSTPNRNGIPKLTSEFSEWMMGLPSGWITAPEIGVAHGNQLELAGNGVVPQAAKLAFDYIQEVVV